MQRVPRIRSIAGAHHARNATDSPPDLDLRTLNGGRLFEAACRHPPRPSWPMRGALRHLFARANGPRFRRPTHVVPARLTWLDTIAVTDAYVTSRRERNARPL